MAKDQSSQKTISQRKRWNSSEIKDSCHLERKVSRVSNKDDHVQTATTSGDNLSNETSRSNETRTSCSVELEAERRKATIDQCIKNLDHSSKCTDPNCQYQKCFRMKQVCKHVEKCQQRTDKSRKCDVCKNVMSLLNYHARFCNESSCRVTRCREFKQTFEMWQRIQHDFLNNLIQYRMVSAPTVEKGQKFPNQIIKPPVLQQPTRNLQPNNNLFVTRSRPGNDNALFHSNLLPNSVQR